MRSNRQRSECKGCGAILVEPRDKQRTPSPCPRCGGLERIFEESCKDLMVPIDGMRMTGKHRGKGKDFFDARVYYDFYSETQEWRQVERHIDRDKNRYIEKITDPKTKEIIKKVDEPLSQHIGHGTAKKKE